MTFIDWKDQANLLLTASMAAELTPAQKRHVAEYLLGILNREPMKSALGWEAERLVLGSLMTELDQLAQAEGEPRAGQSEDRRPAIVRHREAAFLEYDRYVSTLLR